MRAAVVCALVLAARVAAAGPLVDPLAAARDPRAVAAAVAHIEAATAATTADDSGDDELADALLAAGRACEDQLADPARALRLYDRVLRERPDARAAIAAGRRARELRAAGADHPAEAGELARLIASVDAMPASEVEARIDALAARAWPGAPDAALWLARWQQRTGRCAEARPRFDAIARRWPASPQAAFALRGQARCALETRDWADAEELATRLPADTAADAYVRGDLLAAATRGRTRARLAWLAWAVAAAIAVGLLGALVRATRGVPLRRRVRPPFEAMFAAPLVAIVIAIAATTFPLFAPAVAQITIGGLVLAWLSGATLAAHRAAGRATRLRAVAHAAACAIAAISLTYGVMTRTDLVDALVQTVRYGPD